MHLKDPLVLFGFDGSGISLPLFLLSHALPLLENHFTKKRPYGNEKCQCAFKPHSFIPRGGVGVDHQLRDYIDYHPARCTTSWLTQWCVIGDGTSQGTLLWCGDPLVSQNEGGCVSRPSFYLSSFTSLTFLMFFNVY